MLLINVITAGVHFKMVEFYVVFDLNENNTKYN